MTPDQIRLRLDQIVYHETDRASAEIVALLREVLPDLVAQKRSGPAYSISSGLSNERCMTCGADGHTACHRRRA